MLVGGFDQILMYTGFAIVLSSGAALARLFLVHRRGLAAGPLSAAKLAAPAAFVLASAAMVVNTILDDPTVALFGVLLIAAGYPLYAWCRRRNPAVVAPPRKSEATSAVLDES